MNPHRLTFFLLNQVIKHQRVLIKTEIIRKLAGIPAILDDMDGIN